MNLSRFHITEGEVKMMKGFCGTTLIFFFFKLGRPVLGSLLFKTSTVTSAFAALAGRNPSLLGSQWPAVPLTTSSYQTTLPSMAHTPVGEMRSLIPAFGPRSQTPGEPKAFYLLRPQRHFHLPFHAITIAIQHPDNQLYRTY